MVRALVCQPSGPGSISGMSHVSESATKRGNQCCFVLYAYGVCIMQHMDGRLHHIEGSLNYMKGILHHIEEHPYHMEWSLK